MMFKHNKITCNLNLLLVAILIFIVTSCQNKKQTLTKPIYDANNEVLIPIKEGDSTYKVWVKKVGIGKKHLLMLHGGPGCTSEYFENFPNYLDTTKYSLYFYDQLGSYRSSKPKDTSLWKTERFVEELEIVRKGLAIDSLYLLGHSWGGILAIEYVLKYPSNISGLVISNMTASSSKYELYNKELRKLKPKSVIDTLEKYEAIRAFKNPNYLKEIDKIYKEHICRLPIWPDAVNRTFAHLNETVYMNMQGPNEFTFEGYLKGWERWDDMKNLKMPVLTIGSEFDTMNPLEMKIMGKLVKNGSYTFCKNSGHMAMWDNPKDYFEGLNSFLNKN